MSAKRAATTELNHENWDQDDPSEQEEMGTFKAAPKEVLEKRVIRTAKRRSQISIEEGNQGVFSAFGGFNKTQPSSFDFLANLTNGNKNNGSPISKSDTAVTSSLFSTKPPSSSPSGGIFGGVTAASAGKATFGIPTQSSSLFGVSSSNTQTATSIFTASKADSTVGDSPFKIQTISSTTEVSKPDVNKTINATPNAMGSQVSSTIFGVSSTNLTAGKSMFSMTSSTPFKMQPVSSSTTTQSNFKTTSTTVSKPSVTEGNTDAGNDDKKLKYYAKLKGLNESVSDWIKKHVEETPLCILTPIFKDYEKYLKEMQEEYQGKEGEKDTTTSSEKITTIDKIETSKDFSAFSSNTITSPAKSETAAPKPAFGHQNNIPVLGEKSKFSFGITKTNNSTNASTTTAGFLFGISSPPPTTTTASLFSGTTNTNSNGGAPFSFGIGKPFSFSSNIQKPVDEKADNGKEEEANEEEPPKVEFTPVVEENSVFDKRCKIFVKKDGNFVDNGVGTLYIKKIEETGKHQLLVRANTNLGNVLLNLILASAIPTQRMGKNNVMMVCIPTPEAKPPPTPILIRVKTAEEADELLETLNKYKA